MTQVKLVDALICFDFNKAWTVANETHDGCRFDASI